MWYSIARYLASCLTDLTRAAGFAATTPEPAWHRRARAQRSAARTLLRVASAKKVLAQHHSAQQGHAAGMAPRYWCCHGKDCRDQSKRCDYMVPIGKTACDACGHMPPLHVSCPAKATGAPAGGNGKGGDSERLMSQLAASRAELEKTKSSLAEARRAAAAAKVVHAAAGAPSSTGGGESSAEAAAGIKAAREKLRCYRAVDESLRAELFSHLGGFEAAVAAVEQQVQSLGAAKRSALPLQEQIDSAAAHEKSTAKLLTAASGKLGVLSRQQEELAAKVKEQQNLVQKLTEKHNDAKAELCGLTARYAEANRTGAVANLASTGTFVPGTALWKSVGKLVRFAGNNDVLAALGAAGMASEELQSLEAEIRTVQETAAQELQTAAHEHSDDMEEDLDEEQAHDLAEALTEPIVDEPGEARAVRVAAAKSRLQKQGKVVTHIVAKKLKTRRGGSWG